MGEPGKIERSFWVQSQGIEPPRAPRKPRLRQIGRSEEEGRSGHHCLSLGSVWVRVGACLVGVLAAEDEDGAVGVADDAFGGGAEEEAFDAVEAV